MRLLCRAAILVATLGLSLAPAPGALSAPTPQAGSPGERLSSETQRIGSATFEARCAACHSGSLDRAPGKFLLSMMTPESIVRALTTGVMKPMAEGLSSDDKRSVAEFLTQKRITGRSAQPLMCAGPASAFNFDEPPPFAGWSLSPGGDHAIAPAAAGISRANVSTLDLKWALAFPNSIRTRSQPALAGGGLFVGSHDGTVFALDRITGCARWVYAASAEVRTGVVITPWRGGDRAAKPMALFGDLLGNVYGVDAVNGVEVWKVRADPHAATTITGTPTLVASKLIVPVSSLEEGNAADPRYACCTFRGSVIAYDVRTGDKVWQTYLVGPPAPSGLNPAGARRFSPSGVAVWSSPSIDIKRRRIYVATGDNYSSPTTALSDAVVALDLDSGRIVWSYQATPRDGWNSSCMMTRQNCPEEDGPDFDFGAPPILTTDAEGHEVLLAGQKSGIVYGLDPQTGALRWRTRVGRGGALGGVHFGMSAQSGRVFVPITDYDFGKAAEGAPRPGLSALDVKTGRVIWRFAADACNGRPLCKRGFGGVPTAMGPLVMVGGDDGHVRALDAKTGALIWDYDTVRDFTSVNGEIGRGGAIAGGVGPIAYHGTLYVPSGHGIAGKMPGDVLLAFKIAPRSGSSSPPTARRAPD